MIPPSVYALPNYYIYTHQFCCVQCSTEHSNKFNMSNGVKQGGIIFSL